MHWTNRLTSRMRMIPTIQSWDEIRTESCEGNMGRFYETYLYWPLPIRLSFGLFTNIALDLTTLLIFECHSNIHCNLLWSWFTPLTASNAQEVLEVNWVWDKSGLSLWILISPMSLKVTCFDERSSGSNASYSNCWIFSFDVRSFIRSLASLKVGSLLGLFVGLLIDSTN